MKPKESTADPWQPPQVGEALKLIIDRQTLCYIIQNFNYYGNHHMVGEASNLDVRGSIVQLTHAHTYTYTYTYTHTYAHTYTHTRTHTHHLRRRLHLHFGGLGFAA